MFPLVNAKNFQHDLRKKQGIVERGTLIFHKVCVKHNCKCCGTANRWSTKNKGECLLHTLWWVMLHTSVMDCVNHQKWYVSVYQSRYKPCHPVSNLRRRDWLTRGMVQKAYWSTHHSGTIKYTDIHIYLLLFSQRYPGSRQSHRMLMWHQETLSTSPAGLKATLNHRSSGSGISKTL